MKAGGISVWKIQCIGIESACHLTWTKNAACHKCQSADMLEVSKSPEPLPFLSHLQLSASTWTPLTFENIIVALLLHLLVKFCSVSSGLASRGSFVTEQKHIWFRLSWLNANGSKAFRVIHSKCPIRSSVLPLDALNHFSWIQTGLILGCAAADVVGPSQNHNHWFITAKTCVIYRLTLYAVYWKWPVSWPKKKKKKPKDISAWPCKAH